MKKILSFLLAMTMVFVCLFAASCQAEDIKSEETTTAASESKEQTEVTVSRSFVAGYEKTVSMGETEMQMSGRVLMNLKTDGTLDLYVGFDGMGSHENAHYTGNYTLGENEEFDETISFTYTHGEESESCENAVIIDGIFETPFYMISSMTSTPVKFYETAPASVDGDVYVGYLSKTTGMGATVYAYALNMRENGTFDVSIMMMAPVMHVWDKSVGTYTVNGDQVTFTYDAMDGEGGILQEDYTSEGTEFTEIGIMAGFSVAQLAARPTAAKFIKVTN